MDESIELIKRIKKGDESAFNTLLQNYHRLIYSIINSQMLQKGDYAIDEQELYQEASITLYQAVFSYQEDKNVKFSSYAYLLIRSRIYNLLRQYNNIYKEETYSIDNERKTDKYTLYKVQEDPIAYHKEQQFRKELNEFVKNLDKQDKQILTLRADDYSYKDIAEQLNLSIKKVDYRLRVLRRRIDKTIKK